MSGNIITLNDPTKNWFVYAANIASPTGNLYIGNSVVVSGNLIVTRNITANTLTGNLTGNTTNIAVTDTNTSVNFYPTFVSTSGSSQTLRADISTGPLTYNPGTSTLACTNLSSTTIDSTNFTSGVTLVKIVTASVNYNPPFTDTPTSYLLTMPTGCSCFNIISFQPETNGPPGPAPGTTNILYIYDWGIGNWSGVQTSTELRVTAALGAPFSSGQYTIRYYWAV